MQKILNVLVIFNFAFAGVLTGVLVYTYVNQDKLRDEAKERLLINILDTAEPAVKKAKPKRTLIVILSFLFGIFLAVPYTLYLDRRKS